MGKRPKAIILGASSGIGRELAYCLAKKNWQIAITGRRKNLLDETASAYPNSLLASAFDIDDITLLGARLNELLSLLGGLDLLVISAGCGYLNEELAIEPELQTIQTNVEAFTVAAAWAFDRFKTQGNGQLAVITSVGGLIGEGSAPAYSASKAYQIMYLDSLRKRINKENINCRITELRPGSVDTDMMKGEGHFWISTPQSAAETACAAILKGKKLQYISRRWSLIGFALRCLSLFR